MLFDRQPERLLLKPSMNKSIRLWILQPQQPFGVISKCFNIDKRIRIYNRSSTILCW